MRRVLGEHVRQRSQQFSHVPIEKKRVLNTSNEGKALTVTPYVERSDTESRIVFSMACACASTVFTFSLAWRTLIEGELIAPGKTLLRPMKER